MEEGQKTKCGVNKEIAMAPDRNSDRRGTEQTRWEKQESAMLDVTWVVQIFVPT